MCESLFKTSTEANHKKGLLMFEHVFALREREGLISEMWKTNAHRSKSAVHFSNLYLIAVAWKMSYTVSADSTWTFLGMDIKICYFEGSFCGSVGRASNARGPQFTSSKQQTLQWPYLLLTVEKTKINKYVPLKRFLFYLLYENRFC